MGSQQSRFFQFLVILLCLTVLTACGSKEPETPKEVSTLFWEAVISNNQERAAELTSPTSVHYLKSLHNESSELKSVDVSEPVISEGKAVVETTLHGLSEDGEPVSYPTKTHLTQYDGQWRIEAEQTVAMLSNNSVEDFVRELSETLSMLGEQLNTAIEQGVQGFSESMEETLPEINEQLEQLQQSDKFKTMGAQLGQVLSDGIREFTEDLSDGIEDLSEEVEKAAAEMDANKVEVPEDAAEAPVAEPTE